MVAALVAERVDQYLRDCAARVDEQIALVLDAGVHDAWMYGAISYHLGWADTDFSLLPPNQRVAAGKRLRPALALLCFEGAVRSFPEAARGADIDDAVAFATALESLHNYSLIHDDIEDRDQLRRGRPALWTLCGAAQAINVGDCLHDLAYGCLTRIRPRADNSDRAQEVIASFARAGAAMAIGQVRDLALETERDVTMGSYLQMIEGKTAAVLRCATAGGAMLALGSSSPAVLPTLAAYAEFGRELGLGFQMRDDFLGVWGAEAETGKSSGSDIRRKKKGLPLVVALQAVTGDARERLCRLYELTDDLTSDEEDYVRGVLDDCGAAALTQHHVELHRERALGALSDAAGGREALRDDSFFAMLEQLTTMLVTRNH